jgi:hypothetical protein
MKHDHSHHEMHNANNSVEYLKFAGVMILITGLSYWHANWRGLDVMQYLESFMGVFFVVFAGFKLSNLKEFAYGFQSYDIVAAKSLVYSFAYPFIQLLLGTAYLLGANRGIDVLVLAISLISGFGVLQALRSKNKIHCVCLGNVIELPLSTISFVEDFGMALMALAMILMR